MNACIDWAAVGAEIFWFVFMMFALFGFMGFLAIISAWANRH